MPDLEEDAQVPSADDSAENANRFLLAVILDQVVPWQDAWNNPGILKRRLGYIDPERIAACSLEDLTKAMRYPKSLRRFPKDMARCIHAACKMLLERYDCDSRNIWRGPKPHETYRLMKRLDEFPGIGEEKTSMAVRILWQEGIVKDFDTRPVDIALDRHVERVLLRTGLVDRDDPREIILAARKLHPEFPGRLDPPAWKVGKDWCHIYDPACVSCQVRHVCPKLTSRIEKARYQANMDSFMASVDQEIPRRAFVVARLHWDRIAMATLVIVPCGRNEVWETARGAGPTPAKDAYTGAPFKVNRVYAETFGDKWVILSAKYGFIDPDFVIPEDYNVTFNDPSTNPVSLQQLREHVDKELRTYMLWFV